MSAVGHVRYSTAGESGLKNAQPILIDCAHGEIAICHNGNLVNAQELRDMLVREGSIFQTTSDTEVLLHLYARSKAGVAGAGAGRVGVAGAGRVLARAADEGSADCGPRSARIPSADARQARRRLHRLFRDVRARPDRRRVDPRHRAGRGAHHRSGRREVDSSVSRRRRARTASSSTSTSPGRIPTCSARASTKCAPSSGRRLAVEQPVGRRRRRADSGLRRLRRDRATPSGPACRCRWASSAITTSGRTFIEPHQSIRHFGVRVKLNPVKSILQGPPRRARRRLDRARHDQPEDRADGARRGRERSAHADQLSADDLAVLLRRRHAEAVRADRAPRTPSRRSAAYIGADSLGYLSLDGSAGGRWARRAGRTAPPATPASIRSRFRRTRRRYLQLALKLVE